MEVPGRGPPIWFWDSWQDLKAQTANITSSIFEKEGCHIDLVIKPMDRPAALIAAAWEYPEPYHVYNMGLDESSLKEMLGGTFYAVYSSKELTGYFCFGASARIPWAEEEGLYPQGYVDIGLAMRPDLTGMGLGQAFFQHGLDLAGTEYPGPLRLTVACFNHRARKIYQRAGFFNTGAFTVPGGMDFIIMVQ